MTLGQVAADKHLPLIRFQNKLLAQLLGFQGKESEVMRLEFCSDAYRLFSTSISFSRKLKYAVEWLDDRTAREIKRGQVLELYDWHSAKYQYYRSLYHAKLALMSLKNISYEEIP